MPDGIQKKMEESLARILAENPDVKPVTISPGNQGILSKIFSPRGALATTSLLNGNISYDPNQFLTKNPDEIDNIVAHELTHTRQIQQMPWYQKPLTLLNRAFADDKPPAEGLSPNSPINSNYYWRPEEMEAFQTERNRILNKPNMRVYEEPMLSTRDIMLPPTGGYPPAKRILK